MTEKAGKVGAIYAAYGAGIAVANEEVTLTDGIESLANSNVLVNKVTSDGAGANPITKAYYCTVKGSLVVEDGGTDTVYVTYKYWYEGVYAHKDAIKWTAEAEKVVGDRVYPTTETLFYYEVAAGGAGTTGASEPGTWGTTVGATTADDGVTWTCHSYSEVGQVCGFFSWGADNVCDILETTDYCDDGHRTYIANLKGWTGSAERHFLTEENLDWITDHLIIRFYVDTENDLRYEGWVIVDGHGITSAVDTLVNESISFKGDGILNYETT
jgi:hypothetical protein